MHHDAIEFLGFLLKMTYIYVCIYVIYIYIYIYIYILYIKDYFQIEGINMQCRNSCSVISGYTSLDQYYLDITVANSKAAIT